jgi:hypothetical protein
MMMAQGISAAFIATALALTPAFAGVRVHSTDDQTDNQTQVTDAQAFSIVAGQILGAAAACTQIDAARVSAATDKAVGIATETADDDADVAASRKLMIGAAQKGQKAVRDGDADCAAVQVSFAKLEQIENQSDEREQQSQLDDDDDNAAPARPHAGE